MIVNLDPFRFTIKISDHFAMVQILFAISLFVHTKQTFIGRTTFGNFFASWFMPTRVIISLAILVTIHANLATATFQKLLEILSDAAIETFFFWPGC